MKTFIEQIFLSRFKEENFTVGNKAKALLYYDFLMMILLSILVVAYAVLNPAGIVKVGVGAGGIMLFVILSLVFLRRGSLTAAVMVYLLPTIVMIVAARFINAASAPNTAFTSYLYYYFYIIVFTAVFGEKKLVPLTTGIFLVCNILVYILVRDRLDPAGLQTAGTGVANSTAGILITGVISYINIRLSSFSNKKHKEEAETSKIHYDQLAGIFEGIRSISSGLQHSADGFAGTAGSLSGSAQNQAALLEESSASMVEIAEAISRVADEAARQAVSVDKIEKAIRDLDRQIEEVARKAAAIMGESEKAMRQGSEAVDISAMAMEGMQRIHGSAEKIKDITTLITEIADKTNLLSLNASIESARAGEAGKGFAVVADEISKLADNSTSSAKEISDLINETSANINSSYEMFNKINQHIAIINGTLEQSNSMSRTMNEVTGQQMKVSENVLRDVKEVHSLSQSIAGAMNEQSITTGELSLSLETINEITQKNAAAAGAMITATGELTGSIASLLKMLEGKNEPS